MMELHSINLFSWVLPLLLVSDLGLGKACLRGTAVMSTTAMLGRL